MSQLVDLDHDVVVAWDMDRLLLDVDKAVEAFSDCLPAEARNYLKEHRLEVELSGGSFDVIKAVSSLIEPEELELARANFRNSKNNPKYSLLMPSAKKMIGYLQSQNIYQFVFTRGASQGSDWQDDKFAASGLAELVDGYLFTSDAKKAEQLVSFYNQEANQFWLELSQPGCQLRARQLVYFDDSHLAISLRRPQALAARALARVWIPAKSSERQLRTPSGALRFADLEAVFEAIDRIFPVDQELKGHSTILY